METRPFRRTRRPRSKPKVIIIDEEDDENETDGAQDGDVPASSSSPDIVLDNEGVSAVAHPAAALMDTTNTTKSDFQIGFFLYFCLGGAPNFDAQWIPCFTHKSNECGEMPRALRFQRQYKFLQGFSVYLTQCMLEAVILTPAPHHSESEFSEVCGALSTDDI
ncbi:hypothetical protein PsorP6_015192 [Peronosclerospora sorghi]|uniref:Uncharacterized protein n=1 Tax=Peronosclerospora sorghi TaxID=230839 RepID=A0ACC0VS25_9STRA|nr:hypothetical protein PsorP6_015192 [Peronosclerospora sorghi]